MLLRLFLCALALLLTVTGCASTQEAGEDSAASQISFSQVKAAPDSFKGQSVLFGGQVLSARRLKEGTRVEVLQLPLDRSGYPAPDLTQSQGRFIAMHRDFLDPATLPLGTRVTVTGEITGSVTLPLDETEYSYPVIDIRHLQVWSRAEQAAPRIRPYMGPGPYWGPYWSPYWRPWPYW
ncbi:MAG TPA: Slp family lipoprotein [Nitrospira sp.]|nr:Slp family lipoprotein [Nitrospira sp.]